MLAFWAFYKCFLISPAVLQKSAAIVRISEDDIKSISKDLRLKLTSEETSAIYGNW